MIRWTILIEIHMPHVSVLPHWCFWHEVWQWKTPSLEYQSAGMLSGMQREEVSSIAFVATLYPLHKSRFQCSRGTFVTIGLWPPGRAQGSAAAWSLPVRNGPALPDNEWYILQWHQSRSSFSRVGFVMRDILLCPLLLLLPRTDSLKTVAGFQKLAVKMLAAKRDNSMPVHESEPCWVSSWENLI